MAFLVIWLPAIIFLNTSPYITSPDIVSSLSHSTDCSTTEDVCAVMSVISWSEKVREMGSIYCFQRPSCRYDNPASRIFRCKSARNWFQSGMWCAWTPVSPQWWKNRSLQLQAWLMSTRLSRHRWYLFGLELVSFMRRIESSGYWIPLCDCSRNNRPHLWARSLSPTFYMQYLKFLAEDGERILDYYGWIVELAPVY